MLIPSSVKKSSGELQHHSVLLSDYGSCMSGRTVAEMWKPTHVHSKGKYVPVTRNALCQVPKLLPSKQSWRKEMDSDKGE